MWLQIYMKVGNKNSTDISNMNSTSERNWEEKKKANKSQDLYIFIFQLVCFYNKYMTTIIISYRMRPRFCLSYCRGGMSLWSRQKFVNDESKAGWHPKGTKNPIKLSSVSCSISILVFLKREKQNKTKQLIQQLPVCLQLK